MNFLSNALVVLLLTTTSLFNAAFSNADSTNVLPENFSEEEMMEAYAAYIDSIDANLTYETGTISLKDGLATINIPKDYKYLDAESSEFLLTDVWGNPPSEPGTGSLGMLVPAESSPNSESSFVINITYSEEGYIDDGDAKDIDYDELFETMQEDMEASNEYRIENNYPSIKLVGWARPPFYDAENKKLHWAKELNFDDYPTNTLNYNIRVLGRKGYLELNVIGEMEVLDEVNKRIDPVLAGVNFDDGNKYSDFNPDLDKVAAYGIGGLIAGKVLLKAGILAKIGVFLLKFWKIGALAVVGAFAGIRKFFGKKEEEQTPNDTAA